MNRRTTATAELRAEHRLILRVVDAFEELVAAEDPLDLDRLDDCIVFFRLFTDACHHGKEEDVLFTALEEQAPGAGDAIAAMREEHVHGRELVRHMAMTLQLLREGHAHNMPALRDAAAAYSAFIRAHIAREDDGLFELADSALEGPACAAVCDDYEEVCSRRFGGRSLQELEDLAASLTARTGTR
jgi:hemerythrin-like domain-containing protein